MGKITEWLNEFQVSELFGPDGNGKPEVPVSTLRYWRIVGKGPKYFKHGTKVRYTLQSIQDYIRKVEQGNAA